MATEITEVDIKQLLDDAGAAGDLAMVELCRFALAGDMDARGRSVKRQSGTRRPRARGGRP